ncbi:MAG: hypothetical protein AB1918_10150 [Pseudomonadota bacterium]
MGFSTVIVIALAAGVVLVIGGGLMVYMSNLVRSAYELKVQINTEVEERLTKMGDDLDKKARWIKRDLLEEIEKIKTALQMDSARRIGELTEPLLKQLEALEVQLREERNQLAKAIEANRDGLAALDGRVKALQRKAGKKDDAEAEAAPEAAGALDEAAAVLAARAAVNTPPPPPAAESAPPPAPAAPSKPVALALQELGSGENG